MTAAKYANLLRAAEVVLVPPTIFLDHEFFAALIDDYEAINRQIEDLLADMVITSGAVIDRQIERLNEILSSLRTAPHVERLITSALAPVIPNWTTQPLAIRSAAHNEDQLNRSSAGLYASVLNVIGYEAIGAALLTVWRSYFARAAIVERLASGQLTNGQRMCAMVQSMVNAAAAGVAFSLDPVTGSQPGLCEYTAGLADRLVSGAERGLRLREGDTPLNIHDPLGTAGAAAVFATLARLRRHFDQEIDVEWVWDRCDLHVVQVRPISTLSSGYLRRSSAPAFAAIALYDAEDAELEEFEPLPEFAVYFRAKRRPQQLLARALGLHRPPALLIRYNRAGLDLPHAVHLLAEMRRHTTVVIDASVRVRQMLVRGADLLSTLHALSADPQVIGVVALRVFVTGDLGFITQPRNDGRVALEYSRDGLLALNRGTADAHMATLESDGTGRPDWLDESSARVIRQGVAEVAQSFGSVQLEWVKDGDSLIMVDHSPLSSALGEDPNVIGNGYAHAPVMRLSDDSDKLGDISQGPSISIAAVPDADSLGSYVRDQVRRIQGLGIPPILVCRKPYALLAALIPHVSGFIFESAPLLSHLSILIRESRKPALASPDLFAGLADGTWFMLDLPVAKSATATDFAS
jgi:hypothetical protein